ncbi:MAG: apolipoprotein N-acyltransferase, partial [Bacteroidota bacterium]
LYGQFASEKIGHKPGILFILLNEGWYKSITGASQFMYYSAIRAIETRRSVARSSNDGISCTINQKGQIEKQITDFSPNTIKAKLKVSDKKTFYSLSGDYVGYFSVGISLICLLINFKNKSN